MTMNKNTITGKDLVRIMSKVQIHPVTECWNWTAATDTYGCPQVKLNGTMRCCHRVLFKLFNPTADTEKLSVKPVCNNPLCVNPDHQEIRGYGHTGQPRAERKLTPEDVATIKRLLAEGSMPQHVIAEGFGVCPRTISSINTGKTWNSVQP